MFRRRPYQAAYRPQIKRAENGVIARATNTLSQSILEYSGSFEDNGTLCLNFILKFHSATTDNPAFFVAHDLIMDFKHRTNDSSQQTSLPMSVLHVGRGYRQSGYNNPHLPTHGVMTAQDAATSSTSSQKSSQDADESKTTPDPNRGAHTSAQRSGGGIAGYLQAVPISPSDEDWAFDHIEVDSKITCSFSKNVTSTERRLPLPNQCPFHVILAKADQLTSIEIYVYSITSRSDGSSWAVGSKKKYVCTTIQWN